MSRNVWVKSYRAILTQILPKFFKIFFHSSKHRQNGYRSNRAAELIKKLYYEKFWKCSWERLMTNYYPRTILRPSPKLSKTIFRSDFLRCFFKKHPLDELIKKLYYEKFWKCSWKRLMANYYPRTILRPSQKFSKTVFRSDFLRCFLKSILSMSWSKNSITASPHFASEESYNPMIWPDHTQTIPPTCVCVCVSVCVYVCVCLCVCVVLC